MTAIALLIRLATPDDGAALARIYAPAVDGPTSFEMEPPDAAEMVRRLERLLPRTPWLVCEHKGEVLGYAYASLHRERVAYQWSAEVTVYIDPQAHRCGLGRALYTSLFGILRLQGFRNLYAGITLPNAGSVGLHQAMGFRSVGVYEGVGYKCGQWWDVEWLGLQLLERSDDPIPPIPLPELLGTPALEAALVSGVPLLRLE